MCRRTLCSNSLQEGRSSQDTTQRCTVVSPPAIPVPESTGTSSSQTSPLRCCVGAPVQSSHGLREVLLCAVCGDLPGASECAGCRAPGQRCLFLCTEPTLVPTACSTAQKRGWCSEERFPPCHCLHVALRSACPAAAPGGCGEAEPLPPRPVLL